MMRNSYRAGRGAEREGSSPRGLRTVSGNGRRVEAACSSGRQTTAGKGCGLSKAIEGCKSDVVNGTLSCLGRERGRTAGQSEFRARRTKDEAGAGNAGLEGCIALVFSRGSVSAGRRDRKYGWLACGQDSEYRSVNAVDEVAGRIAHALQRREKSKRSGGKRRSGDGKLSGCGAARCVQRANIFHDGGRSG